MPKTATIIGTRPELIKMSRVISKLDLYTEHTLIHTGQNYDYTLNGVFFDDLSIRQPDHFLGVSVGNPAQSIASIIELSYDVLKSVQPDALLLYGDTNSCLSVIAAKRLKIPVFHMEAGNRCFDQRVPEELNRKVVDHLSDVNLVLTEHARRNLIAEGLKSDCIFKTGSHMREVIDHYKPLIDDSTILSRLSLQKYRYILASLHREENIENEDSLNNFLASLFHLLEKYQCPIVVSTHPRTRKRLTKLRAFEQNDNIFFLDPFGFTDYVHLQLNALAILSDSGTITEEASILNLPAITLRSAHERPEGMDSGVLIMSPIEPSSILNAVSITIAQHKLRTSPIQPVPDYQTSNVSDTIVRIVLSYIDYVRSVVWRV